MVTVCAPSMSASTTLMLAARDDSEWIGRGMIGAVFLVARFSGTHQTCVREGEERREERMGRERTWSDYNRPRMPCRAAGRGAQCGARGSARRSS